MGAQRQRQLEVELALTAEAGMIAGRAREQIEAMGRQLKVVLSRPLAVGDAVLSLEPDHAGQRGTVVHEARGGDLATVLWVVDFAGTKRVLRGDLLELVDCAPYPWARQERRPIAVGAERPPTCECGHLDSLHSKAPGLGCTHRPYCLWVHPTGQRVPRTRVRL